MALIPEKVRRYRRIRPPTGGSYAHSSHPDRHCRPSPDYIGGPPFPAGKGLTRSGAPILLTDSTSNPGGNDRCPRRLVGHIQSLSGNIPRPDCRSVDTPAFAPGARPTTVQANPGDGTHIYVHLVYVHLVILETKVRGSAGLVS